MARPEHYAEHRPGPSAERGDVRRDRRPGRPAPRRLPRPARRTAAPVARGRARAVPRRGREGRTTGRRGRLPGPVLPDGAPLARRARRRPGAPPTRPATWSARPSPSRSPASTSTGAPWPRWPGRRCRRSTRCSTAPAPSSSARTSSTTPTSAPSSAPPPRSASTRCCWRPGAPIRCTGARSRWPWVRCSRCRGRVSPDWYDALPDLERRGFHTVALTLADGRRPARGGGVRTGQVGPDCRVGRSWFVRALGARPPSAGR